MELYTETLEESGGWRLTLTADPEPEWADPRDATCAGVMMAEGHRNYVLGDGRSLFYLRDDNRAAYAAASDAMGDRGVPFPVVARYLRVYYGATVVLPLWLIDHSGISMCTGPFTSDPAGWDSGIVGVIFDTPATRADCWGNETPTVEQVTAALESEVATYASWLEGDVWTVTVERMTAPCGAPCAHCAAREGEWETVDSLSGIIGRQWAESEGRAMLDYARQDARVTT